MSEMMCKFFLTGADVKSFRQNCKDYLCACPKNTNAKCEIIPKKPKMVRVKAWAVIKTILPKDGREPFKEVDIVRINPDSQFISYSIAILIDEKYLQRNL